MSPLKVLLATDGTGEADQAERVLRSLPFAVEAEITVAMVVQARTPVPATAPSLPLMSEQIFGENDRIERYIAGRILTHVCERLNLAGLHAEPLILQGNTADELLRLIEDLQPDLVVAGSGVKDNFKSVFLGSVARKLILYSRSSVLIGRQPREGEPAAEGEEHGLNVMVAIDGSPGSESAVQSLTNLAKPVFEKAYALCVEPMSVVPDAMDLTRLDKQFVTIHEAATHVARDAASKIQGCAKKVIPLTDIGRPSISIVRHAQAYGIDLILLGSCRHGPLERLIVGSCAYETAMSAPCSVLVLRNPLPLG